MGKLVGIKQFCEYVQTIKSALNQKVDKVTGKGLSTNDYTTAEKDKLAGIASGAEVNVQSDWSVTSTTSDAYIKNKPSIPSFAWTSIATTTGSTAKTFSSVAGYNEVLIECQFPNQNPTTVNKYFSTIIPKSAIGANTLEVWVGGGKSNNTSATGGAARAVCNFTQTSIQGVSASDGGTDRLSAATWYVKAR